MTIVCVPFRFICDERTEKRCIVKMSNRKTTNVQGMKSVEVYGCEGLSLNKFLNI